MNPSYQAALAQAVYYPVPEPGALRLRGEDRLAFLQRQTTNNVNLLGAEHTLVTVLTSPAARILDVLRLVDLGDALLVLTLPGQSAATARFLKSRIFFMDKVSVEDISAQYAQVDLEGPQAGQILMKLGFPSIPAMDALVSAQMGTDDCQAIAQRSLVGAGYRLLIPAAALPVLEKRLNELGASPLPAEVYHVLRLEVGLPAPGAELTEAYTPLETGMDWAVADNKGCYTGQEVIARQITYDKVTQRLVGLRLSAAAQPGEPVWVDGRQVGQVTSAADSPRFGWIALAVVKRPFHEPGTAVQIGSSPHAQATVSPLPFR